MQSIFKCFALCIAFVTLWHDVYGYLGDDMAEIIQLCCNDGAVFAMNRTQSDCSEQMPPTPDVPLAFGSMCTMAKAQCCKEFFKKKNDCGTGVDIATSTDTCEGTKSLTRECCDECLKGTTEGKSKGPDACVKGSPFSPIGAEEMLTEGAFVQCCKKAAKEWKQPAYNDNSISLSTMPSLCEDYAPTELCAHHCIPVPGSYRCECNPGFMLMPDGRNCKEVTKNRCKPKNHCQHKCNDNGVEVKCSCRRGYELMPDGKSCQDIDECQQDVPVPCLAPDTRCHNVLGSYKCVHVNKILDKKGQCPPGFLKNPSNNACDDINECLLPNPPCPSYACENTIGGYKCDGIPGSPIKSTAASRRHDVPSVEDRCPPGFKIGLNEECEDVDECATHKDDCNPLSQFCINTHSSFYCQDKASKHCPPGFMINPRTNMCEDIDECEDDGDICRPDQECVNQLGQYDCKPRVDSRPNTSECPDGMRKMEGSLYCEDIDECADDKHLCDINQSCLNTNGSYDCHCKLGYELDITTGACADVNECATGQHDCVPQAQRCDNTVGSYLCIRIASCGTGYVLHHSTGTCEDIDECALGRHDCGRDYSCFNIRGSFRCIRRKTTTTTTTTTTPTEYDYYYDSEEETEDNQISFANQPQPGLAPSTTTTSTTTPTPEPPLTMSNSPSQPETRPEEPAPTEPPYPPTYRIPEPPPLPPMPEVPAPTEPPTIQQEPQSTERSTTVQVEPAIPQLTFERPPEPPEYIPPEELPKIPEIMEPPVPPVPTDDITEPTQSTVYQEPNRNNYDQNSHPTEQIYEPPQEPSRPVESSYERPQEPHRPTEPSYPQPQEPIRPTEPSYPKPQEPIRPTKPSYQQPQEPILPTESSYEQPQEPVEPSYQRPQAPSLPTMPNYEQPTQEPSRPTEQTYEYHEPEQRPPSSEETLYNLRPYEPQDPEPSTNESIQPEEPRHPETTYTPQTEPTQRHDQNTPYSVLVNVVDPVDENAIGSVGTDTSYLPEGKGTKNEVEPDCPDGFEPDEFGACFDIDECVTNRHSCSGLTEVCKNTLGGYTCNCAPGFRRDLITKTCDVITTTSSTTTTTTPPPTTSNNYFWGYPEYRITARPFKPHNLCDAGFRYNTKAGVCEDINECTNGQANCAVVEICVNTEGGYRCECPPNWKLDDVRHRCMPVRNNKNFPAGYWNEPVYPVTPPKDITAENKFEVPEITRVEDKGSVLKCRNGYRLGVDNTCVDVNECHTGEAKCGPQQICYNLPGGYSCNCPPGHRLVGDHECEDVDECATAGNMPVCSQNADCVNTVGSYKCNCHKGFRAAPVNDKVCVDVDECVESRPGTLCQQRCNNVWGGYRCGCHRGYMLNADNKTCSDIDECSRTKILCVGRCLNEPGSYRCACPSGYRLSEDRRSCIDIDECETGEAPCSKGGASTTSSDVCVNTRGSYHCRRIACPNGYQLENKHRCNKVDRVCEPGDWLCTHQPTTISYNFITFVSNLYIPDSKLKLFSMRGPQWQFAKLRFELKLISVDAPPSVKRKADINDFLLTNNNLEGLMSLVRPLEGPQTIELEMSMELYTREQFGGTVIAKLFIYVSEYEF